MVWAIFIQGIFWYGIFCHGSFWYGIFCPDTFLTPRPNQNKQIGANKGSNFDTPIRLHTSYSPIDHCFMSKQQIRWLTVGNLQIIVANFCTVSNPTFLSFMTKTKKIGDWINFKRD